MSPSWVLHLRGFGVAFGSQVVLTDVDLDVPARGVVSLVGGAGTGKSTLLRTLAGLNDAQPELLTWGHAIYDGGPLGARRPALVQQRARLLAASIRENLVSALPDRSERTRPQQVALAMDALEELGIPLGPERLDEPVVSLPIATQRALAIARASLTGAALCLIDEPTAQLEPTDVDHLVEVVARLARTRAVILVSHDQRVPRRVGGRVALLAGGRILETRRAESFFDRPASEEARTFVRTGRTSLPSPAARPEDLRSSAPPPAPLPPEAEAAVESRFAGPSGFHWLVPGSLGGLPRPGIVRPLEEDLAGLRRLGVTKLVTLEETRTLPRYELRAAGIEGLHFPVADMGAPTIEATESLCERVEAWTRAGEVVAMHCRAGFGRTGTQLAAQLIWRGRSALEALETVRAIHPRWVQSDVQVDFLARYGDRLARRRERTNEPWRSRKEE